MSAQPYSSTFFAEHGEHHELGLLPKLLKSYTSSKAKDASDLITTKNKERKLDYDEDDGSVLSSQNIKYVCDGLSSFASENNVLLKKCISLDTLDDLVPTDRKSLLSLDISKNSSVPIECRNYSLSGRLNEISNELKRFECTKRGDLAELLDQTACHSALRNNPDLGATPNSVNACTNIKYNHINYCSDSVLNKQDSYTQKFDEYISFKTGAGNSSTPECNGKVNFSSNNVASKISGFHSLRDTEYNGHNSCPELSFTMGNLQGVESKLHHPKLKDKDRLKITKTSKSLSLSRPSLLDSKDGLLESTSSSFDHRRNSINDINVGSDITEKESISKFSDINVCCEKLLRLSAENVNTCDIINDLGIPRYKKSDKFVVDNPISSYDSCLSKISNVTENDASQYYLDNEDEDSASPTDSIKLKYESVNATSLFEVIELTNNLSCFSVPSGSCLPCMPFTAEKIKPETPSDDDLSEKDPLCLSKFVPEKPPRNNNARNEEAVTVGSESNIFLVPEQGDNEIVHVDFINKSTNKEEHNIFNTICSTDNLGDGIDILSNKELFSEITHEPESSSQLISPSKIPRLIQNKSDCSSQLNTPESESGAQFDKGKVDLRTRVTVPCVDSRSEISAKKTAGEDHDVKSSEKTSRVVESVNSNCQFSYPPDAVGGGACVASSYADKPCQNNVGTKLERNSYSNQQQSEIRSTIKRDNSVLSGEIGDNSALNNVVIIPSLTDEKVSEHLPNSPISGNAARDNHLRVECDYVLEDELFLYQVYLEKCSESSDERYPPHDITNTPVGATANPINCAARVSNSARFREPDHSDTINTAAATDKRSASDIPRVIPVTEGSAFSSKVDKSSSKVDKLHDTMPMPSIKRPGTAATTSTTFRVTRHRKLDLQPALSGKLYEVKIRA